MEAVFGIQGSHIERGALFLSANLPEWCSDTRALRFDIPPTLHSLGGSALVAELLAIHTGGECAYGTEGVVCVGVQTASLLGGVMRAKLDAERVPVGPVS